MMQNKTLRAWSGITVISVALLAGCSKQQTSDNMSAKPDTQIAADIQNKINSDAALPNKQIAVGANNGVVTLSGSLASENERIAAASDAAQVAGVKTVVNNLVVDPAMAQNDMSSSPIPSRQRSPSTRSSGHKIYNDPLPTASTRSSEASTNMANSNTPPRPAAPVITEVTVPAGSVFSIRTIDVIDTSRAQVGDSFNATLDAPIEVDGKIAIPAHADVQGRVADVRSAGKFEGSSQLTLQLTKVSFAGKSYRIVTDQWSKTGASRGKNTAEKVGGGAAVGALIGAIAGGGKGAAIGAGVGAGVGGGAQAVTHGQQIVLNPETVLSFTLRGPVTVMPAATNRNRQRLAEGDHYSNN